jgi:hypothetical protein
MRDEKYFYREGCTRGGSGIILEVISRTVLFYYNPINYTTNSAVYHGSVLFIPVLPPTVLLIPVPASLLISFLYFADPELLTPLSLNTFLMLIKPNEQRSGVLLV